jgi:hypothetical protein
MSDIPKRNLPASVRQRLLNLSMERSQPFDLVLVRYGIERPLYRLSRSHHAEKFLLKGAMIFVVWGEDAPRPTRDVDLLGFGPADEAEVKAIFVELCGLAVEPDGLEFMATRVEVTPIREDAAYTGIRVRLEARLARVRIPIQVDIGYGDAVTPAPTEVDFPALLDFPAPRLRAYAYYTVVAEKLEAAVLLGAANTRLKDFFDLWYFSRKFEFDGLLLTEAVRIVRPVSLRWGFAQVPLRSTQNALFKRPAIHAHEQYPVGRWPGAVTAATSRQTPSLQPRS